MNKRTAATFKDAQKLVKDFSNDNGWKDVPNIDKFDHIHEELIEMSKLLRYKTTEEMIQCVKENRDDFEDGLGDTMFGLCRLANQLGLDMEKSFNISAERILEKYSGKKDETKHVKKQ